MELMKDGKITGLEDRVNRAHEKESPAVICQALNE